MPGEEPLTEYRLTDYLAVLSSAAPAPGGGSVAALTAAQSAALLCMVGNLTVGRPRFAAHEHDVRAILAEAETLRATCEAAIDRDAVVLRALLAAYRLPKGTAEERATRATVIQQRLRGAIEVPLAVARAVAAIVPLCQRLLPIGNPATISDVGVSAAGAAAAFRAAELNVAINLAQLADAAYAGQVRAELAALGNGLLELANRIGDDARARI